ncbi:MAG: hypothetical protein KGJ93_01070 [Patescibacteria group bacterium]|nr:hypothetical protein [Patescibacteria group bacterium]
MTKVSGRCPYCGNNPVPHLAHWYFETLDVGLAPLRRFLLYNAWSQAFGRWLGRRRVGWRAARLCLRLGLVRQNFDLAKCKVRRAQVLWEEAKRRGIVMSELTLFGKGIDVYLAEKTAAAEDRALIFSGLPRPDGSGPTLDMMDDKLLLKRRLAAAGLPVPQGGAAWTVGGALKIFRQVQKPVIVKPRSGSRGRHTTTFIFSENDLRRAVKVAKQLCSSVVVEQQLLGPVYRATVIGGPGTNLREYRLAGVLRGDGPQVTGDGRHSIGELVNLKNQELDARVKKIQASPEMDLFLSRQGLALSLIVPAGQLVSLSEKVGLGYGGSSSEDFDICHPDNKELFLRAAAALGDSIVGFDFMIPDIAISWKQQKCGFIEANSLPFINLHHDPLKGTPRNAAALVWDSLGW